MRQSLVRKRVVLLVLSMTLVGVLGSAAAASGSVKSKRIRASADQATVIPSAPPTFVGPAATGCNVSGCSLLTGPVYTTSGSSGGSNSQAAASLNTAARSSSVFAMPFPTPQHNPRSSLHAATMAANAGPVIPSVTCPGSGCDSISTSSAGAVGVKGLNAVDSVQSSTLVPPAGFPKDIEPPDQGLCAGNGYVLETNNIGEILAFNTSLQRQSAPISLDTVMGLPAKGWSSGGDPSCQYDPSNGGHFFITEIVSASSEANGGPFTGCFAGAANGCYEGIAVSRGANPLGPYYVYYANANYNPSEPGYPYLLNDYAKISVTRDAFLMFYDEFPLNPSVAPGLGGGGFNGAQELAFNKTALETGQPVTSKNGKPNRNFSVAIDNMGLLATPDGSCAGTHGAACWYQVIPAQPADGGQFDNSHGGSGFMLASLDFFGQGDTTVAAFDWTGLSGLTSNNCNKCSSVAFGGQVFSGVEPYYGEGFLGVQKAGPIPLGDQCGTPEVGAPTGSCAEGGIATNGDGMTQAAQAQGELWGAISTEVNQALGSASEIHQGAAYWVIGTDSFDRTGVMSLTSQGYVSAAREDLEFPTMAGEGTGGNGGAIMSFTVNGDEGRNNGFYPSSAYGRLTAISNGLTSKVNIADLGRSPQDGFTEYAPFPTTGFPPRPRWGDYGAATYLPGGSDRLYFASEYIQYPNCEPPAFDLNNPYPTCGGTRDGYANWGTSVNYVVP